jgi:hypothetical protein
MEPKHLTRKDGKFLEARVIVEKGEVNQGNLVREFSVVVVSLWGRNYFY